MVLSSLKFTGIALLHLLTLFTSLNAYQTTDRRAGLQLPLPHSVVYQFPDPTWIENIAVRSNGNLLVTLVTTPEVWEIDPETKSASLVHTFAGYTSCLGITELGHDKFYVVTGNFTLSSLQTIPGTYSIWEINMRGLSHQPSARVDKVVDLHEAHFLNGMTTLSEDDGTVLIADSELGLVWRLNVETAKYEVVIDIPEMKPPPPPGFQIGVNGLKIEKSGDKRVLYFSTSGMFNFHRVPISSSGFATGPAELIASGLLIDDFALDNQGNAWLARNVQNLVSVWLAKDGSLLDVEGAPNQLTVAGGTACAFGRKESGDTGTRDTLYVTTTGSIAAPINGTVTEGGKIVAILTEEIENL